MERVNIQLDVIRYMQQATMRSPNKGRGARGSRVKGQPVVPGAQKMQQNTGHSIVIG